MGGWALVPKPVPDYTEGNLDLEPGWDNLHKPLWGQPQSLGGQVSPLSHW